MHNFLVTWKALIHNLLISPSFNFSEALILFFRIVFVFPAAIFHLLCFLRVDFFSTLALINILLGKLQWIGTHLSKKAWSLILEVQGMSRLSNEGYCKRYNDLFLHF
jgi:hypothetical protein